MVETARATDASRLAQEERNPAQCGAHRGLSDRPGGSIELCRARLPRTSYSKELVERLFVQPYVKTEHLVKAGIAERRTAATYLRQLEDIGVLRSFRVW